MILCWYFTATEKLLPHILKVLPSDIRAGSIGVVMREEDRGANEESDYGTQGKQWEHKYVN